MRTQNPTYDGLTIQFTLSQHRKLQWINDLRDGLYPGHDPAHVTVFPVFSIEQEKWLDLLNKLAEVAAGMGPFFLTECGMCHRNDWVAIRLCDEENPGGNRCMAVMKELKYLIPDVYRVNEPHITVYRGRSTGTYVPYFGEWLGTPGIRKRVKAMVDGYAHERWGDRLAVRATGLQILQHRKVVDSFKFSCPG
ncbi:hypothetical protein DFH08DRAFT_873653 [Mycena albidolilacea]|uniref:Uncharacterized protein n=1 Tax=Mycena albidolilacea TaxID=1033008 RepID=A0AAD7ENA3_9AGAR|nr:hypothetical protein DFH08DRAFT_873653 [Mycena albidolilacea]